MSHFTVMVIGNDHETQLAPYQENNMEDCPEEFLEFNDVTEESMKEYNEEGVDMWSKDVKLLHSWDEFFKRKEEGDMFSSQIEDEEKVELGWVKTFVPFKEKYKSFEGFMSDWKGMKELDRKTGKYGYWENPQAKWDWYSLGGRWAGFFKLKSIELAGIQGHHRAKDFARIEGKEIPDIALDKVDQAKKKDIDFEGMLKEHRKIAQEYYEKIERLCGGTIPKLDYTWSEAREKFKGLSIDEIRAKYHGQYAKSYINDLCNADHLSEEDKRSLRWAELDVLQISKDEYIENSKHELSTFAVIKDGKWYQRGEMGWWACVSDEKEDSAWDKEFLKMLDEVDDETTLTVVDCHI